MRGGSLIKLSDVEEEKKKGGGTVQRSIEGVHANFGQASREAATTYIRTHTHTAVFISLQVDSQAERGQLVRSVNKNSLVKSV